MIKRRANHKSHTIIPSIYRIELLNTYAMPETADAASFTTIVIINKEILGVYS